MEFQDINIDNLGGMTAKSENLKCMIESTSQNSIAIKPPKSTKGVNTYQMKIR